MIEIKVKKDCCGCHACATVCNKQCITMHIDEEGFLYPVVNHALCTNCGLCEKVCPVINQNEPRRPLKVYAAINKNEEIRLQSSSGGIFTLLAEKIIDEGGVVFGARFDENWEVKHDYTKTIEGLAAFRGSKYVQSRIEDNFKKAERFLKEGCKVLFSGTPCQIAGLKRYLRKDYDNLLTVDFICHGVPSPGVWRKYLKEIIVRECKKESFLSDPIDKENTRVENINFRDKKSGWKNFNFALTFSIITKNGVQKTKTLREDHVKNLFMKGFLSDIYLRPSCYDCPSKCSKSGSDLTIADLWHPSAVIKNKDDDKGISLVIINNKAIGIDSLNLTYEEIDGDLALKNNPAFFRSVKSPIKRVEFYRNYISSMKVIPVINSLTNRSFLKRVFLLIKRVVKTIIVNK